MRGHSGFFRALWRVGASALAQRGLHGIRDDKFDRSEDVLDYFDVRKGRVIEPQPKELGSKGKFAYPVKRNSK